MYFDVDDRVQIYNFPDTNSLNLQFGTILGCSVDNGSTPGWSSYIVLLDNPIPSHKAIVVTNACLRPEAGYNEV